jgi:hypothetical protein
MQKRQQGIVKKMLLVSETALLSLPQISTNLFCGLAIFLWAGNHF